MDATPIRIMVVDDHPLVRMGVCALIGLQTDMQVVGDFDGAQAAIDSLAVKCPDILLMDLRLRSFRFGSDPRHQERTSAHTDHRPDNV